MSFIQIYGVDGTLCGQAVDMCRVNYQAPEVSAKCQDQEVGLLRVALNVSTPLT